MRLRIIFLDGLVNFIIAVLEHIQCAADVLILQELIQVAANPGRI